MSASPFSRPAVPPDRRSDAPMAFDLTVSCTQGPDSTQHALRAKVPGFAERWLSQIPPAWLGMCGYLVAGVGLGLVLLVALSLARGSSAPTAASAGVVTDDVVHLAGTEVSPACWQDAEAGTPARVTVSLEVGLDGKVRSARAGGGSRAMRACVESHVLTWEFLPQANPSQMVLPVAIDPR